jgi:acyl transferase domain-containing protein
VFWAFMYWYFLGGGAAGGIDAGALTPAAVEELSERVAIVVEDPVRAEAAQSTLADLKREAAAFEKKFTTSGRAIRRSYANHAAERAEIEAVLEQLNRDWERGQQRALDLGFELREQLTREEWNALYSVE